MCYNKPWISSHSRIPLSAEPFADTMCIYVPPDMGADSVSSTLSSLSSAKPPPTQDDFDVFAQTRTGVLSTPAHAK